MKLHLKLKIFIFSLIVLTSSVTLLAQKTIWTVGSARTVPKKEAEFGILHPLRYGISDKTELSTSPLLLLGFSPNISVKHRWIEGNFWIASKHSFNNPSLLLEALSDIGYLKDTLDQPLIDDTPFIYSLWNEGIATYRYAEEHVVSGHLGFRIAFKSGDSIPVIEKPFLFQRSSIYHRKVLWYLGFDFDGNIYESINYSAGIDFLSVGAGIDNWAVEHNLKLIWNKSVKFAALIGYSMSYGSYPSGNDFGIVPMIDLIWKINKQKRRPARGLWRRSS